MSNRFKGIAWSTILFAFAAPALLAQNAAVVGTVRDAQDAVVPNAVVSLKNIDTGVSQATESNEAGLFEFPNVRPGSYSVKVEKTGFKSFQQAPVAVAVDQR